MKTTNPENVILNFRPYLVYKDYKGIAFKVCVVSGDKEYVVWRRLAFRFSGAPNPMPRDAIMAILLCDMN